MIRSIFYMFFLSADPCCAIRANNPQPLPAWLPLYSLSHDDSDFFGAFDGQRSPLKINMPGISCVAVARCEVIAVLISQRSQSRCYFACDQGWQGNASYRAMRTSSPVRILCFTCRTDHDLNLDRLDRYLPLWYTVQDLYSTDSRSRWCRSFTCRYDILCRICIVQIHDLDHLDHYLPLWYTVQDLYSTDPRSRWSRSLPAVMRCCAGSM